MWMCCFSEAMPKFLMYPDVFPTIHPESLWIQVLSVLKIASSVTKQLSISIWSDCNQSLRNIAVDQEV